MATFDEMDQAAEEAAKDLSSLDPQAVKAVADWWSRHYTSAGHKRLGRQLVNFTTSEEVADIKAMLED